MEKNCMTDIYKTYKKDTDKSFDEDFDTGNTYYDDDYIESENENDDKYLEEDTHARYAKPAGDKTASYNNALTYAKKENKPFIYGYSNHDGKFFALEQPIKCVDLNKQTAEFKSKYKNCKVVYVAYPDKDYIKEDLDNNTEKNDIITEDYNNMDYLFDKLNYYANNDSTSLDMDLLNSVLKEEKIEESYEDNKKRKALEYYNKIKDWASDAKARTSCIYNIDSNLLTEWIGDDK